MGVSSLWKVLDEAGCGKPVGVEGLVDIHGIASQRRQGSNPWNMPRTVATGATRATTAKPTVLAVDLSIWICESFTSHGMNENHANPTLHLVFSRTMRLLNLGIKLVFVVEGKRRVRATEGGDPDQLHKRRNGTRFWKACQDSKQLLEMLGVPVVHAKAEGEALCALLNVKGVVDGVISNDGDCLLFGAKIVFTKFSIENMENGTIMRYEAIDLHAVVDAAGDDDATPSKQGTLSLSRTDLIAFALLTGSDLAGNGFPKVGRKKAVRFLRKCQLDFPLRPATAAIEELESWARCATSAESHKDSGRDEPKAKCCSRCCHVGTKSSHVKHGCAECGTGPGEPCLEFTADDRFRESLRAKALSLQPPFDPLFVVESYMKPNDGQMPLSLIGTTAGTLKMGEPDLASLLATKLIVKGQGFESSRDFIKKSVGGLLARAVLQASDDNSGNPASTHDTTTGPARQRPVPVKINKTLVQQQTACYEVVWLVRGTVTNDDGDDINGFEHTSVESQSLIQQRFPQLVASFAEAEKERLKQGDAEQLRRREFLDNLNINVEHDGIFVAPTEQESPNKNRRRTKKRQAFFGDKDQLGKRVKAHHKKKKKKHRSVGCDDVQKLLRFANCATKENLHELRFDVGGVRKHGDQASTHELHFGPFLPIQQHRSSMRTPITAFEHVRLNPLFCEMGSILVEITPVVANFGAFPPRNIYICRE